MLRILWSSRSAMAAQQEKLDSISNNIANVNTEGYKRVDVSFRDLVYETLKRNGYPNSGGADAPAYNGTGVRTGEWIRDTRQGNLTETGMSTDLAIDGEGYFEVILPEQNADGTFKTAYTRSGSFNIDSNNNIVDKNGNKLHILFNNDVTPENMKFTKDNFKIDESGNVYIKDGENFNLAGKVNLYNVAGENSLKSIGNNLFIINTENINGMDLPVEIPYIVENSSIRQGFLELSNVDLTKEMTDMIMVQRAFELSSRAMRTADEMWGMANNLRSR